MGERQHLPLDHAWKQFSVANEAGEFCQAWLDLQCHMIADVYAGVIVLQKPHTQNFGAMAFFPRDAADRSHLAGITERVLRDGRGIVEPVSGTDDKLNLGYPVRVDGLVRGVVALSIATRSEADLQLAMRQLQWGAGWIEVLLRRDADPVEAARAKMKIILQLVSTFIDRPTLKDAATALATELASLLGCDRVVLALLRGTKLRVEAVSHTVQFDHHANLLNATIGAMHEALDQHEPIVFPPDASNRLAVTIAHAELARSTGAGGIATFPLLHDGRQLGALVLERASGLTFDAPSVELLEGLTALLGPLVDLQVSRSQSLPGHLRHSLSSTWGKLVGPRHGGLKLAAFSIAALGVVLTFATGSYRISADARIEGEIQRALTAPFQGYVRETTKRAGDTVNEGEVLARLDDRDLRLERVRLEASREQYLKQYREGMAKRERAQASIVSAQVRQVEAQLALVEEQLSRTEIIAPFKGVLVSGDLSQSLGAPLERGQVLFEVAPLDAYRVVLQIDERDIAEVKYGQPGELVLSSLPGASFPLAVSKITPVSTPKEGRNVFRVEAQLRGDTHARLRPGMEGVAKVDVDERRLISIWTRQLTNWVRLKSWAWTP